jgi:hypothetical protein
VDALPGLDTIRLDGVLDLGRRLAENLAFTIGIPRWAERLGAPDSGLFLLFGPPAPVKLDEIGPCLWSQVVRLDRTGPLDGRSDLFQVGAAIRTRTQMRLEAAPVTTSQGPFEVVGNQLDGLLAHQVSWQDPHGQPL